jgi:hypothetical protein
MSTLLFCPAVIDQIKGVRNVSDFIVIQLRLAFSLNLISKVTEHFPVSRQVKMSEKMGTFSPSTEKIQMRYSNI